MHRVRPGMILVGQIDHWENILLNGCDGDGSLSSMIHIILHLLPEPIILFLPKRILSPLVVPTLASSAIPAIS